MNYNVTITTSEVVQQLIVCMLIFAYHYFNEDTTICRTDSLVLNGLSYTGNYEVLNTTPTIAQMGLINGPGANYLLTITTMVIIH